MSEGFILVADDSREICQFLEESVLKPAGYTVRTVGDGLSAFTLARDLRPDLVITDQRMPALSGIELTRRLHVDQPFTPVILMTTEGSEALAVEAIRAGAADYLTKPFEAEHLLAAVGRALSESRRWKSMLKAQAQAETSARNLERRLHELETLVMIGRTVTAMLDLDEVLKTVVEAAVRLTEAEEGSLLLIDEESSDLYMRASKNFDEEFARTFRIQTRDSLAGQVIATGKPMVLDEGTPQKIKTSYLVHSLIYVPLRVRGKTIGVLGVDNRRAGRMFTHEDSMVMMAMADYAAIAVENATLFNRSETERRKLDAILTQTEDGVIVVDPDSHLLLMNRSAREAFGVSKENLTGRRLAEVIGDPRLLALVRSAGDHPRREEIELSDGRVFNAQRTPIQGIGQAIVMQDITHLKELDKIKSEFVTTVSHDLRSPLTAILGYVELIERAGQVNEQQHEFIRRVRFSVEQISNLITDLLDLGRIEAGLDVTKENTPIAVLTRYAVESLRGLAETRKVKLVVELPEEMPMVAGDPIRLRQMIGNLIENGLKYTPERGSVRISGGVEGDQVILRVSDTGMGIPPADQPYLFDKFFRASNVPDSFPGTGLGLSIVKSIVEHHFGRIWVESKLGEGTTFTVVLPTAAA